MEKANGPNGLKPCPNCGADNSHAVGQMRVGNRFVGATDYYVRCDDCGFIMRGYTTEMAAVQAWNQMDVSKEGKRRIWHDLKKNPNDMPEEHDSIFAYLKGTDRWNQHMFEKVSDRVDVTVEMYDGTREVDTAKTKDGEWSPDRTYFHMSKVIAWRERPEPYRGDKEAE